MEELRAWLQLIFVVAGGVVALAAFFQNLKQRRVENALKFVALFRSELREGDLAEWEKLFRAASEPAGCPPGEFRNDDGKCMSIGAYFSEGSGDNYAISRMAQSLDVVCHQVVSGTADARTVFYELGQPLRCMNSWLSPVRSPVGPENFLQYAFPSINAFFEKYGKNLEKWPCRVYAYIE